MNALLNSRVTRPSRGWYLLPSDAPEVANATSTVVKVLRYPNLSVRKYMSLTLIPSVAVSVFAKSYGLIVVDGQRMRTAIVERFSRARYLVCSLYPL